MMFAVMMGSITFQKLEQRGLAWCSKDRLLTLALTLAGGAFTAMVYDNSTSVSHWIRIESVYQQLMMLYPIATDTCDKLSCV